MKDHAILSGGVAEITMEGEVRPDEEKSVQIGPPGLAPPIAFLFSVFSDAGLIGSIGRRISRNRFLGAATSANWKVTYRPWLSTLAPIFTSFSRSVVSDQCSTSFDKARVWFVSNAEVQQRSRLRRVFGVEAELDGEEADTRIAPPNYESMT